MNPYKLAFLEGKKDLLLSTEIPQQKHYIVKARVVSWLTEETVGLPE